MNSYALCPMTNPAQAVLTTGKDFVIISRRIGMVSRKDADITMQVIEFMDKFLNSTTEMLKVRQVTNDNIENCLTIELDYLYDQKQSPKFDAGELAARLEEEEYEYNGISYTSRVNIRFISEDFSSSFFDPLNMEYYVNTDTNESDNYIF